MEIPEVWVLEVVAALASVGRVSRGVERANMAAIFNGAALPWWLEIGRRRELVSALISVWADLAGSNQTRPVESRHVCVNFGRSMRQAVRIKRLDCAT